MTPANVDSLIMSSAMDPHGADSSAPSVGMTTFIQLGVHPRSIPAKWARRG